MILLSETISTPLGDVVMVRRDGAVTHLDFAENTARLEAMLKRRFGAERPMARPESSDLPARLTAWFAGDARAFDGLPLDPGGTPFQARVWTALRQIPYGATLSYGELAAALGQPTAVRAVARANGANPISLIIPCHRLIGKDGDLTGYAGGLARKARLLALEQAGGPAAAPVPLPAA